MQEKEKQISDVTTAVQEKEKQILTLNTALEEKELYIATLNSTTREKDELYARNLNNIYNSRGWKLISLMYKVRDILIPPKSKRRKLIKYTLYLKNILRNGTRYLKAYGLGAFLKKVREKLAYSGKNEKISIQEIDLFDSEKMKMKMFPHSVVSIVIPTKNAGGEFADLLNILKNQRGLQEIEIIIVDSGSTDGTVETAKKVGAKVIEIRPEDFSHSYARNVGAENSKGDYLLFMTQDALPTDKEWAYKLLYFLIKNNAVAVSCVEEPREDCDLAYRVICWNHYRFLEVDSNDRILIKPEKEDYVSLRKNGQLSDIACFVKKEIFMKYKYRNSYAEDLDLGIRLIKDGYRLGLLNSVKVIHSHNRPSYYFLKRGYVDNLFLINIFEDYPMPDIKANSLFADVVKTNVALKLIVDDELSQIVLPCSIQDFTDKVDGILNKTYACNLNSGEDINQNNRYIDENFARFLRKVYTLHMKKKGTPSGLLMRSLVNSINIALEYMKNNFEVIDENTYQDFVSCIYKHFATICGVNFSSCYLKSSDKDKELLKDISSELTKGV